MLASAGGAASTHSCRMYHPTSFLRVLVGASNAPISVRYADGAARPSRRGNAAGDTASPILIMMIVGTTARSDGVSAIPYKLEALKLSPAWASATAMARAIERPRRRWRRCRAPISRATGRELSHHRIRQLDASFTGDARTGERSGRH